MKKALLIASVLFIAVITTACINNIAVQELNNKVVAAEADLNAEKPKVETIKKFLKMF